MENNIYKKSLGGKNMGRGLRIEYYGAIYHIIQRGNNRKPIFKDEKDKEYLLELFSEAKEIYGFKIFAYVIMDNHYHFLIQTFNVPISKIMHTINTRYAKYYNYKMDRRGPVFEGRYKGILVQDDSYFLTLLRYIHNNPVFAKICSSMEGYKWSSDPFYRVNMEGVVDIGQILDILSLNRIEAIKKYVELMEEESLDYETMKNIYEETTMIGTERFKKSIIEIEDKKSNLDEILRRVCPSQVEFELIKSGSRKRYLTKYKKRYAELCKKEGYTYSEIGANIGVSGTSVGSMLVLQ
jgi:REP element-mobilizing transposase RayT